MKDWQMYYQIQKLKALGFKKNTVRKKLDINPRTVVKYWDMSAEEFKISRDNAAVRTRKPDEYRSDMTEWLKQYPDMSAAQMFDWLEEKYGKGVDFKERTMRSYIQKLRLEEGIPKTSKTRQYEAVDELPPGYQAQVDMGQIWLKNAKGKRVCLYCLLWYWPIQGINLYIGRSLRLPLRLLLKHTKKLLPTSGDVRKKSYMTRIRFLL